MRLGTRFVFNCPRKAVGIDAVKAFCDFKRLLKRKPFFQCEIFPRVEEFIQAVLSSIRKKRGRMLDILVEPVEGNRAGFILVNILPRAF